ncbi:MAG: class II glutamine amidotransferase [Kofleriaceae bacterium]
MKLFACMCNQPQRLWPALAPVRQALVAQPPVSRWGMAYSQGGDVLLVRTPKSSTNPVDLAAPLAELQTDCAVAVAVQADDGMIGTDNTPPFRFRRWMFAMSGTPQLEGASARLLEHVPEYLRRNLRGRTPGELVFHVFLAMLHDEGSLDDPNLPLAATRRALAATIKLVAAEQSKTGTEGGFGNLVCSNGRSMVLARIDHPLKLRRLWVNNDRNEPDPNFRGLVFLSGGDGEAKDGFEDIAANRAVLISRDLSFTLADLNP